MKTKRPSKKELEEMSDEEKKQYRTKAEVYSRVVGYLRPVEQWNDGKQEEFKNRQEFKTD